MTDVQSGAVPRVVLLGGMARVGKSLLANRLATDLGGDHVECDVVRKDFIRITSVHLRRLARINAYLDTVASALQTGRVTILEGDDLIARDRSTGPDCDSTPDLTVMLFLRDYLGCTLALVGPGPDEVAAHKADVICDHALRTQDWVFKAHGGDPETIRKEAHGIAKYTIRQSERLRKAAARHNIPYLMIDTDSFEANMTSAFGQLRDLIPS